MVVLPSATANEPEPMLAAADCALLHRAGASSTKGVAYVINPATGQPTQVSLTPLRDDGQVEYGPWRDYLLRQNVNRVQECAGPALGRVGYRAVMDELELHLIGFARYPESILFVENMRDYVRKLRPETRMHLSKICSVPVLMEELRRPADLVLVSGHGPAFKRRDLFDPFITDDKGVRLRVSDFPSKIGARSGIIWDLCNAGRPQFRDALALHLEHEVTNVGVIGLIGCEESKPMVEPILRELLSPESPLISPDTVAAAASVAKSETEYHISIETLWPPGVPQ